MEVNDRTRSSGYRVVYEPTAIIGHAIARDRIEMARLRMRVFWQAVSDVVQGGTKSLDHWPIGMQLGSKTDLVRPRDPQAVRRSFEGELKVIYRLDNAMACSCSIPKCHVPPRAGVIQSEEVPAPRVPDDAGEFMKLLNSLKEPHFKCRSEV
jgi:hypothetical protein